MSAQSKISFIRGRRLRVTRLSATGLPVYGDEAAATSKGFVSVAYTTNLSEGEGIDEQNAGGESCVYEPGVTSLQSFSVEATFCDVDFAVLSVITGQEIILDADGKIIGMDESTDVDMSAVAFALEVWPGAQTDATPSSGSEGFFGYVLTPYLTGGVVSDITVENAAISFTVTGMTTKNGNNWGSGPYNVELVGGVPAPLSTPLGSNSHRRIMFTEVAPPTLYTGLIPVLDPTEDALTSVAGVATLLSVEITPTPAGGPVWYDFGDGTWDYSETGAHTHVYAAAGTYTITARRGLSVATTSVTVTA